MTYRWGQEVNYYLSFAIPGIQGNMTQADGILRNYYDEVMQVVRKLHELRPLQPRPVYRGMLLNPEHVDDNNTVGRDPLVDSRFVSYSEDRNVACWFADRNSMMNSIGIGGRVDMNRAQGWVVEANPKPEDILFHWSWGLNFPWMTGSITFGEIASRHMGIYSDLNRTIDLQREVMLLPADERLPATRHAIPPCLPTDVLDSRLHYGFRRNPNMNEMIDEELNGIFDAAGAIDRIINAGEEPEQHARRYRRNSDEELRAAERRWQSTGAPEDEARYHQIARLMNVCPKPCNVGDLDCYDCDVSLCERCDQGCEACGITLCDGCQRGREGGQCNNCDRWVCEECIMACAACQHGGHVLCRHEDCNENEEFIKQCHSCMNHYCVKCEGGCYEEHSDYC